MTFSQTQYIPPSQLQAHNARKARMALYASKGINHQAEQARKKRLEATAKRQNLEQFRAVKKAIIRENNRKNFKYSWQHMVTLCGLENRNNSLLRIAKEVAEKYNPHTQKPKYKLTAGCLKSKSRLWILTVPRFEFIYRARTETNHSLPDIGRFLGGRDHTTILHAFKKYRSFQESAEPGKLIQNCYPSELIIPRKGLDD